MNMMVTCAFCGASSASTCCQLCGVASRVEKFLRLLNRFERASNSIRYHEDIVALVERSGQVMKKTKALRNIPMVLSIVFGIGGIASFCTESNL